MGYDLYSQTGDEYVYFNFGNWPMLLSAAESYGWKPAGTQAGETYHDPSMWEGTYLSNDGQIVTAQDAAALADALERVLDDIPDKYFSDNMKKSVVEFILMCRKGAFEIW